MAGKKMTVDVYDHILHRVIDYCNEMIKDATVQMVTNINPENDVVKYTYNSLMRYRIADIRSLKANLISEIKKQVLKAKKSGVKDEDIQLLGSRIEKIINEKKDILDGGSIKTTQEERSAFKALIDKITGNG